MTVSMTQQAGPMQHAYGQMGGPSFQPMDYRFPMPASRGNSIGWELAGLAALALVVVGGIYIWPDVQRYIRIKNM